MKGFYISISNGLLQDGHRARMGVAVWEFMWCIDKVTRVDEDGIGHVLGGKPIQIDDIAQQMGSSRRTVIRNLMLLERSGYITKLRTPYGMVIKVMKAKKKFGRQTEGRSDKSVTSKKEREVTHVSHPDTKSVTSKYQKCHIYIDKTVDKTVDKTTSNAEALQSEKQSKKKKPKHDPLGAEIIKALEAVDPKNKTYYNNTSQRAACDFLLSEYGLDATLKRIEVLPRTNKIKYFPDITTPCQLRDKWVPLQNAVDKYRESTNRPRGPNGVDPSVAFC